MLLTSQMVQPKLEKTAPGGPNVGQVTGSAGSQGELHEHIQGRGIIAHVALGLSDGLVTNLAFLAGFAGAVQDVGIIRFAGIAAMLAGAVSMFFGGLISEKSEHDLYEADAARELFEIEKEPDEERQELKSFYLNKGLTEEESDIVVKRITSNKQKWLEDLLIHELHIHKTKLGNPLKVASAIGLSFLLGAFVPLAAYFLVPNRPTSLIVSIASSLVFLFLAGGWKGRLSGRSVWRAGFEMLLVGAFASIVLYAIGSLLVFV
ncbi:MAG: VIT1/CCC1 transporter family protein [Thaumarchaeota archaeon]|nr:VIT1/CCC1 transporter family protein [Nitrososphaerota archaeon]